MKSKDVALRCQVLSNFVNGWNLQKSVVWKQCLKTYNYRITPWKRIGNDITIYDNIANLKPLKVAPISLGTSLCCLTTCLIFVYTISKDISLLFSSYEEIFRAFFLHCYFYLSLNSALKHLWGLRESVNNLFISHSCPALVEISPWDYIF